jgi:DNA-binding MarR family transcriptional regulator
MPAQVVKREHPISAAPGPRTTVIGLVREMGKLMVEELTARLRAAGFVDLNASHHPVFESLDPAGTRLTELAARAGMTHQSMGELVAALEQRGYLARRPDPTDRRARLVCLTPKGQRMVRRALHEIDEIETSWSHRLQTSGCPEFRNALESALREATESSPAPSPLTHP